MVAAGRLDADFHRRTRTGCSGLVERGNLSLPGGLGIDSMASSAGAADEVPAQTFHYICYRIRTIQPHSRPNRPNVALLTAHCVKQPVLTQTQPYLTKTTVVKQIKVCMETGARRDARRRGRYHWSHITSCTSPRSFAVTSNAKLRSNRDSRRRRSVLNPRELLVHRVRHPLDKLPRNWPGSEPQRTEEPGLPGPKTKWPYAYGRAAPRSHHSRPRVPRSDSRAGGLPAGPLVGLVVGEGGLTL